MMGDLQEFASLWLGTVIYRPYVYGFFLCFLFFSIRQLKVRGTIAFLVIAYLVAYASEFSATRNGFPFGMYVYLDETRTRELWLANIPFWDSLSFVFLSYFSWLLASICWSPRKPNSALLMPRTALLGGFFMMLLDVIIDPLTLHGDQWFLGKIYYYPKGGQYFGVTLSNFAGWWFVGTTTLVIAQLLAKKNFLGVNFTESADLRFYQLAFGVYAGVMAFNLFMTAWIHEWVLLSASLVVAMFTLGFSGMRIFKDPLLQVEFPESARVE